MAVTVPKQIDGLEASGDVPKFHFSAFILPQINTSQAHPTPWEESQQTEGGREVEGTLSALQQPLMNESCEHWIGLCYSSVIGIDKYCLRRDGNTQSPEIGCVDSPTLPWDL